MRRSRRSERSRRPLNRRIGEATHRHSIAPSFVTPLRRCASVRRMPLACVPPLCFPPILPFRAPSFRKAGHTQNPTKTGIFRACDSVPEFGYITRPLPSRPRQTRCAQRLPALPEVPCGERCRTGPHASRATAMHASARSQEADPKVSFAIPSRAQMQQRTRPIRNSGFAVRISGYETRPRSGAPGRDGKPMHPS
jgi:hypothetical protein